MTKKLLLSAALVFGLSSFSAQAAVEKYTIDTKGMHAFVTFKVKHLGYSWLQGRFNNFSGNFDYDESNPSNNKVTVDIDVKSLDSNHAERDKHLKSDDFFDADKYPDAGFVSTKWVDHGNGKATLKGKFTLRGISKNVDIAINHIGGGKDPWGGFRRGFEGVTTLNLSDYKMKKGAMLGPAVENVEVWLSIEGVRQ